MRLLLVYHFGWVFMSNTVQFSFFRVDEFLSNFIEVHTKYLDGWKISPKPTYDYYWLN